MSNIFTVKRFILVNSESINCKTISMCQDYFCLYTKQSIIVPSLHVDLVDLKWKPTHTLATDGSNDSEFTKMNLLTVKIFDISTHTNVWLRVFIEYLLHHLESNFDLHAAAFWAVLFAWLCASPAVECSRSNRISVFSYQQVLFSPINERAEYTSLVLSKYNFPCGN
jgi:hypothetical protein